MLVIHLAYEQLSPVLPVQVNVTMVKNHCQDKFSFKFFKIFIPKFDDSPK